MGRPRKDPSDTDARASLTVKLTIQEKQLLARAVMRRKLANPTLPVRWGLSDYVREILLGHLQDLTGDETEHRTH